MSTPDPVQVQIGHERELRERLEARVNEEIVAFRSEVRRLRRFISGIFIAGIMCGILVASVPGGVDFLFSKLALLV